jgi:hypothetical protein
MEGGSAPRRRVTIAEDELFQSIAENKFSAKDTVAPMAAMQCINGIVTDLAEYMNAGSIDTSLPRFNIGASR